VIHRTRAVAVITAAAVGVVGVLSAISIQRSYDSGLASEGAKLAATAQVTAALISQQMASVEDIERATLQRSGFITAIGSGAAANIDTSGLQLILNEVQALRPEFQFAAFADALGNTRATAPLNPAVIGRNFSFRDWYRGIVRTESPYVSSAYIAATTGAPLVVAVASPVRARLSPSQVGLPTGPVIGVLFIGYKIGSLQAFANELATVQQINLLVTDQAGIVLTRKGGISGHLTGASGVPGVAAARAGQSTTSTSGSEITGGVPIGGLDWTVIASTPVSGTAAAAQRSTAARSRLDFCCSSPWPAPRWCSLRAAESAPTPSAPPARRSCEPSSRRSPRQFRSSDRTGRWYRVTRPPTASTTSPNTSGRPPP
jgi:hypothetical protein